MGPDHRRQLPFQSRPALGSRATLLPKLEAQRSTCAWVATGDGDHHLTRSNLNGAQEEVCAPCLQDLDLRPTSLEHSSLMLRGQPVSLTQILLESEAPFHSEHMLACVRLWVASPAPQLKLRQTNKQTNRQADNTPKSYVCT